METAKPEIVRRFKDESDNIDIEVRKLENGWFQVWKGAEMTMPYCNNVFLGSALTAALKDGHGMWYLKLESAISDAKEHEFFVD